MHSKLTLNMSFQGSTENGQEHTLNQHYASDLDVALIATSLLVLLHGTTVVCKDCVAIQTRLMYMAALLKKEKKKEFLHCL